MNDEGTLSVDDIDLSDNAFWQRPYRERAEAFRLLRHVRPISHFEEPELLHSAMTFPKGNGYYAVTRYADVAEVTRRPDVFLSGHGSVTMFDLPPEMAEYFSGMISTDDPKHARLRRIVSNAFNPRNVRAIEESIESVAGEIVTRALEGGSGDFVTDIASPYPSEIICQMMGVPKSEYETVVRCASVVLSNGDEEIIGVSVDPVVALLEAGATLIGIMEELGKYRIDQPIDDVTSALVNAEIESERLTQQELSSFFVLLMTAGSETTRTALSHALHYFGEFPDQQRRLADDFDGLAKTATDEIVRYSSPIGWTRRTLASDYTLAGVELKAGEHVVQFYGSANRDETRLRRSRSL